jgi:hypothetical protein
MPTIFAEPGSYDYAHTERRWSAPGAGHELQEVAVVQPSRRQGFYPSRQSGQSLVGLDSQTNLDLPLAHRTAHNEALATSDSPSHMGVDTLSQPQQGSGSGYRRQNPLVRIPSTGSDGEPRRFYDQGYASAGTATERPRKRRAGPTNIPTGSSAPPNQHPLGISPLYPRASSMFQPHSKVQQHQPSPLQLRQAPPCAQSAAEELRASNNNSPGEVEPQYPEAFSGAVKGGSGAISAIQSASISTLAATGLEAENLNDWYVTVAAVHSRIRRGCFALFALLTEALHLNCISKLN